MIRSMQVALGRSLAPPVSASFERTPPVRSAASGPAIEVSLSGGRLAADQVTETYLRRVPASQPSGARESVSRGRELPQTPDGESIYDTGQDWRLDPPDEGRATEDLSPKAAERRADDAERTDGAETTEDVERVDPNRPKGPGGKELSDAEVQQVRELQARDREVRAYEQAHKAAAGGYGGAISYSYQTGPDSKRYAVGGHVPIDMSPVPGDPEATARKMQVIRRAALAPTNPSSADRQVAAQATQREAEARMEANAERAENVRALTGSGEDGTPALQLRLVDWPSSPPTAGAADRQVLREPTERTTVAAPPADSDRTVIRRANLEAAARRAYIDAWRAAS